MGEALRLYGHLLAERNALRARLVDVEAQLAQAQAARARLVRVVLAVIALYTTVADARHLYNLLTPWLDALEPGDLADAPGPGAGEAG